MADLEQIEELSKEMFKVATRFPYKNDKVVTTSWQLHKVIATWQQPCKKMVRLSYQCCLIVEFMTTLWQPGNNHVKRWGGCHNNVAQLQNVRQPCGKVVRGCPKVDRKLMSQITIFMDTRCAPQLVLQLCPMGHTVMCFTHKTEELTLIICTSTYLYSTCIHCPNGSGEYLMIPAHLCNVSTLHHAFEFEFLCNNVAEGCYEVITRWKQFQI